MSTNIQLRGDSLRRQKQLSADYAAEHGLILDQDFSLEDIGISAFRGDNVRQGNLGKFLAAVEEKKIKAGSYLLVESLDRLSRQRLIDAQPIFFSIIRAGINIVTLADKHLYKAGTNDLGDFVYSLVALARAHDESATKSLRVSQAWDKKRRQAKEQKLTAWCPQWLTLNRHHNRYEEVADRATIIRSIFEDCAAGIGNYTITRRLNERGVPCFGRSNGWHNSYVAKILNNPAAYGEFQPHKLDDSGKRIPDGPPVKDYFPAVITEELFYRAKNSRSTRDVRNGGGGKGRKGKYLSNLFAGLCKCAYCDAPMRFENKGSGPKGGTFLVCDSTRRGLGCGNIRWSYKTFETSFLQFVRELQLQELAVTSSDLQRREGISAQIEALEGEIKSREKERDLLYEQLVAAASSRNFYSSKLEGVSKELDELAHRLTHKKQERARLMGNVDSFYESKQTVRSLILLLQQEGTPNEDTYRLRSQIASKLKSLVEKVFVAGLGSVPFVMAEIDRLVEFRRSPKLIATLRESLNLPRTKHRYFSVLFKNGPPRIIAPNDHDPYLIEQMIEGEDGLLSSFNHLGEKTEVSKTHTLRINPKTSL